MAVGIRAIRTPAAWVKRLLAGEGRPARRPKHRPPRSQGQLTNRRAIAIDAALAVAATAYSLLQLLVFLPLWRMAYPGPDGGAPSGALLVAVTAAEILAALSVLVRRRLPLVLAATSLTDLWVGGAGITFPLAIYTLVVRGRTRWAVAVGLAGATVPVLDFLMITGERPPVLLFVRDAAMGYVIPTVIAPALVATAVRTHRALIRSLRRTAEQLQREQELATRNARLEERARMARDIHDVVAHYVGLIVIQSGALEISETQGSAAYKSARLLGDLGRRAMGELRDLLDALRYEDMDGQGGGAGEEPAGSQALGTESWRKDVQALVNEVRRAGVPVTWQVSGEPERAGAAAQRAAYRVIQEGIANAVRHAPGAEVYVSVAVSAQSLDVSIRNGRPPEPVAGTALGGGHGLIGIRERVSMLGGAVRAFATPQGGFSLVARIPAEVATPDADAAGRPWAATEFLGPRPPGEPDDPGAAGGRRGTGAAGHTPRARIG
ncbi:sensor histidine kinase [Streptomyces sioyaensis]|uniref:sensor histidine kinase n=1 Tax=Streptomyces sioyaensis TaxID=67364 RepID=UPI0037AF3C67